MACSNDTTTIMESLTLLTGSTTALIVALLFLCYLFVCFIVNLKFNNQQRPKVLPGPSPWPVVGNLPELLQNKPVYKWIHSIMNKLETDIACVRLGSVNVVFVSSAELARAFLHDKDDVFASRPVTLTGEHATYGFLTMGLSPMGQQWKKMRKMYTRELVSPARLRWLHQKRNDESDNLVRFIYSLCCKNKVNDDYGDNDVVFEIRSVARHYILNVVRKMVFGVRYFGEIQEDGGPGEAEEEYVKAVYVVLKHINAFCVSDYLPWLRVVDIDGHERIVKKAMSVVDKYHNPIIEERLGQWKDGQRKQHEDLLDVMISLKDVNGEPLLSLDEIKAQCIELMFPTSSSPNAVEWIMAEMMVKPHLLREAVNEIDTVVGKDRLVQESDISNLNYLKACARESLRLHPVSPFSLPHLSISSAMVAGYFIPKGSQVMFFRREIGRQPKVWDQPLEFKPERHFKDEISSKIELTESTLDFISFGTGKRGCPAISLGTTLTVMALGRLLHGFTWSLPPNEEGIELVEAPQDLSLAKPLMLQARLRLPLATYSSIVSNAV